ncbi:MAG: hypothetical protein ACE149_17280 [Armatimonadota bacterium]
MPYLIQGDEFDPTADMRERLAQVMAESGAMLLADARYRIRHAQGVLQFEGRAEAERVAARFADLGFANFLLDELLPVPRPRLVGVGGQLPQEPIGLVVLAMLSTETTRVVTEPNQLDMQVGYGVFTGLGLEVREQETVTERKSRYLLDLFTPEQHWRVQSGMLPRVVEVFTSLDVSQAHLNEGIHSLSAGDRRMPSFSEEKGHQRYLQWLFQLRFAGQER